MTSAKSLLLLSIPRSLAISVEHTKSQAKLFEMHRFTMFITALSVILQEQETNLSLIGGQLTLCTRYCSKRTIGTINKEDKKIPSILHAINVDSLQW